MASDGKEEREFYIKLRNTILGIDALKAWMEPDSVIAERTLTEALEGDKGKFRHMHISFTDSIPDESPHKFGFSGEMMFLCFINVIVRNDERMAGPLPAQLVGITSGPSLSIVDGALRNALHDSTLDGWCWVTELGAPMNSVDENIPEGCVGRSYPFKAIKEVER